MKQEKLGIALVGLGEYSTTQLMPALKETQHCYLAALVSGTPDKLEKYKAECGIADEHLYSYDDFDKIADDETVDIIYIVLPNSMHAEFCIRAARAGKHIICEKPMAMNVKECQEIIREVDNAGVRFSMGYRLHFDPNTREVMRMGQQQTLGQIQKMTLLNGKDHGDQRTWRSEPELAGGGTLMNYGVYCIQAAIYLTGKLPVSVSASFSPTINKKKYDKVEEGIKFTLRFDEGMIAECECSYAKQVSLINVRTEAGWFQLDPGFEYEGIKGQTSEGTIEPVQVNQQARQMDDFAKCIIEDKPTRVPAEMGMRDMEIVEAIYKSAKNEAKEIALNLTKYTELIEL